MPIFISVHQSKCGKCSPTGWVSTALQASLLLHHAAKPLDPFAIHLGNQQFPFRRDRH